MRAAAIRRKAGNCDQYCTTPYPQSGYVARFPSLLDGTPTCTVTKQLQSQSTAGRNAWHSIFFDHAASIAGEECGVPRSNRAIRGTTLAHSNARVANVRRAKSSKSAEQECHVRGEAQKRLKHPLNSHANQRRKQENHEMDRRLASSLGHS